MYTFVLLKTIKFALFSEKPYVIVFICSEKKLMEVINLAVLPTSGNPARLMTSINFFSPHINTITLGFSENAANFMVCSKTNVYIV